MGIEKHKAYIDFSSQATCQITTIFRQKTFDLKDGDIIDLVKLEKVTTDYNPFTSPPCAFFATCSELDDKNHPKYIIIEVWALIDISNQPEIWGQVDLYQGPTGLYEGRIWTG